MQEIKSLHKKVIAIITEAKALRSKNISVVEIEAFNNSSEELQDELASKVDKKTILDAIAEIPTIPKEIIKVKKSQFSLFQPRLGLITNNLVQEERKKRMIDRIVEQYSIVEQILNKLLTEKE